MVYIEYGLHTLTYLKNEANSHSILVIKSRNPSIINEAGVSPGWTLLIGFYIKF